MHMAIHPPSPKKRPLAGLRIWPSRCGKYVVIRMKPRRRGARACVYFAKARTRTGLRNLSRHHTWRAAQRACERHAKPQWK